MWAIHWLYRSIIVIQIWSLNTKFPLRNSLSSSVTEMPCGISGVSLSSRPGRYLGVRVSRADIPGTGL